MPPNNRDSRGMAHDGYSLVRNDGYSTRPLTEGPIRKGGSNSAVSQIRERPPAPAPMRRDVSPTSQTGQARDALSPSVKTRG
jgi:hypothetical protein